MRLQMITDAANKRQKDEAKQRKEDYDHLMQIKKELADENTKKQVNKAKEKKAALRVIRENDANKQRRIQEEEKQKEMDANIVKQNMREAARKEQ